MRVGWMLALVGLLSALAVPALAAPGTIAVRAELPLQLAGQTAASGPDAEFLLQGTDGTAAITLAAEQGQATRWIHRMWGYVNTNEPQLGVVYDDDVRSVPVSLAGATLTVAERRDGFQFLATDGDLRLERGATPAPLLVGALESAKAIERPLDDSLLLRLSPPKDGDAFDHSIPAGSLEARSTTGRLTAAGPVELFLSDAVVDILGPDGPTRVLAYFREEPDHPGTIYNPLTKSWSGPGKHTEYIQEYLRVSAAAGFLDVAYAGQPGSLFSSQSVLDVDGVATLPAATGTVAVEQDGKPVRHEVRGADLGLGGRFTLRAHDVLSGPARAQVDGEGDLTTVTYAGVAAEYDWTAAAAAAGLGAIALAALGWLAFHAKAVSPALGSAIAGYARVSGQEVLDHPGRSEVYERVKGYPGISFAQLADAVGFGQSTLNYHLRVLEKNEFITAVKDGRYLRFFDRQAGTYAGHRKLAVSALRNQTTAAMARHIKANPGVVQRDLAAAFGVTASTVNWHVTRLEGAGLVSRTRDAHFTRYFIADGWSQLPADEAQRQDVAATPVLAAPVAV